METEYYSNQTRGSFLFEMAAQTKEVDTANTKPGLNNEKWNYLSLSSFIQQVPT